MHCAKLVIGCLAIIDNMVVGKVIISPEVYRCCLEHALSTEKEEVMGLLIGQVESYSGQSVDDKTVYGDVIHFEATKIIRRKDKRPDRVEIPVEQLIFGLQRAEAIEKIGKECDKTISKENSDYRKLRVLGWYHSHPHITVWPSHVDLATQFNHQAMDENFVGLIFSVFNDDNASKTSCFEITCFQTHKGKDGDMRKISIPIEIEQESSLIASSPESSSLRRLIESERLELPATLHEEEIEAYKVATCQQTADHTDDVSINTNTAYFDQLASIKNDAALKLGHVRLFEHVTIPLLEQKQAELEIKRAKLQLLKDKIQNIHKLSNHSDPEQNNIDKSIFNQIQPNSLDSKNTIQESDFKVESNCLNNGISSIDIHKNELFSN